MPGEVLVTLATRYLKSPPGTALQSVARYVHDCMADSGIFGGHENVEPRTSMGMWFYLQWLQAIVDFVVRLWSSPDFDDAQAATFTDWALNELLPTPPATASPQEQLNLANFVSRILTSCRDRWTIRGLAADGTRRADCRSQQLLIGQ